MHSNFAPRSAPTEGDLRVPAAFALFKLLLHLPFHGRYGFHHDELYFLACGRHLAFGYVDHAPMVPWIARFSESVFGDSLHALRFFPALAGALAVFITGVIARELGGRRFAQAVACLAFLVSPAYLRMGHMLSIPSFEALYWGLAALVLIRIIKEDRPRLFLLLGAVAGVGMMNKHSMVFPVFGLSVGLLLTPERKYLAGRWYWLGACIALLIFLPNLIWQIRNGWPTLEFLRNENRDTMSGISTLEFLIGQILYMNPLAAPVWLAGLGYLVFANAVRPYRSLGFAYLAMMALLIVAGSKIYYLMAAYPMLLAAGGVAVERGCEQLASWRLRAGVLVWLGAVGALMLPMGIPILSLEKTDRYITKATMGAIQDAYELTGDLHGMVGWPELADRAAEAWNSLSPEDRKRGALLGRSYSIAGAIDLFGPPRGLPSAISVHNSYHFWGPGAWKGDVAIALGWQPERLEPYFQEVKLLEAIPLEAFARQPLPICIVRGIKKPISEVWREAKTYD